MLTPDELRDRATKIRRAAELFGVGRDRHGETEKARGHVVPMTLNELLERMKSRAKKLEY